MYPVTQQYYLHARFYNPVIGRFTQEDTYYGDGLNLYQYCQANPVGYVDPSGHNICPTQLSLYKKYKEFFAKKMPEAEAKKKAYEYMRKKMGLTADNPFTEASEGGGPSSSKVWDYSKQFDGELANFNAGYEIKGVIDEDIYLVQFHSNAEVGSGRSLKYWTTFDEANGISTVDDYMNRMALLSNWGARDNVSIAKIPAGTKIEYAIGTAKEQAGATESSPGGGRQILFEQFDDAWVLDTRPLP
uniref:RHS repeat-associated core domain-containing protein n=1 Tax=Agathobacter sp. TaxID=2021311 RepID=UPI0040272690